MSQTPPVTRNFTHSLIGPLTGLAATPQVTHFRSIPFATIPSRFRQSILLNQIPSSHSRSFTSYGPACPSPPQTDQIEAVGGLLPGEEEKQFDESSCLNLTISVPNDSLGDAAKKLPVMVYVHGGGFMVGSGHISALHDTTRLAELSITEEKPVIIVSIHYRLHWLGFLACQDLLDEAKALGEAPGNSGLRDQRNAFLWIKKFIGGFGGDEEMITAFGESAGSGSIALHMCSDVPLFNRAVLMSGVPSTLPPLSLEYKEAEYRALLKFCAIDENDPDRLVKLRAVPAEKIVEASAGVGVLLHRGFRDDSFWPKGFPTYWSEDELITGCPWVHEAVIGDYFYEEWLLVDALKHVPRTKIILSMQTHLGLSNASELLASYEIHDGMDANMFWNKLSYIMGDMMFSQPTHKVATALASTSMYHEINNRKKVYRYTQTLRNPFQGSALHQIPGHHFIDTLFLFQTLQDRYPAQKLRDISYEYGKRWITFASGEAPWEEYRLDGKEEQGKIMVINGRTGFEIRTKNEDEVESELSEEGERRYKQWQIIGEIMESLGTEKGERARWRWGTDNGIFRLAGLAGPYEEVVS